MIGDMVLFLEILLFFVLLFWWIRRESIIHNIVHRAYENLEQAAEKRVADNRQGMLLLKERKGILHQMEQKLLYSGLTARFPFLTPEVFIALNLMFTLLLYTITMISCGIWWMGGIVILGFQLFVYFVVQLLMAKNYNAVDGELLKFLDFLGNYSITSGEVTNILQQISGYLEKPLQNVLEECYYEAQTTGDTSLALLSMAEKIQHPKFKELVQNLEISMRYSADFTILVNQSRKSVREHMRMRQEQKALAGEAWVNILILGAMTLVILKSVEILIGVPIEEILLQTWPGRGCLGGILFILFLFYQKIRKLNC